MKLKSYTTQQQLEFRQLELDAEKLWEKLQNIIIIKSSKSIAKQDSLVNHNSQIHNINLEQKLAPIQG